MYSELWSSRLRQGDIVGPIPIPLLGKKPQVITSVPSFGTSEGEVQGVFLTAPARYAAVVSHDCEFNEEKREFILLARVQRIDPRLTPEQIEVVRLSNDVRGRHAAGEEKIAGVDNFLIDPIEGHLTTPHVIAFTAIVPFPTTQSMLDDLHRAKRAELVHDERCLLKQKLAWFFIRTDDDVPAADKRPKAEVMAELARSVGEDGS
jgi:hypothetical protein